MTGQAIEGVSPAVAGRKTVAAGLVLVSEATVVALAVVAWSARTDVDLRDRLWWIVLLAGTIVVGVGALFLRRRDGSRHLLVELARAKSLEAEARSREALARRIESEQQRGNAEALQMALLPSQVPPPPGCELATRYWPAVADTLVGGDFYDVFAIDEHRWALTIGDVCGHGIGAAALTGLARHTLRSAARYSYSPAEILRSVHVAIAEHDPAMFCTACLILYRPDRKGGGELITTLGGHPHPLLRSGDHVHEIGATGTLLGQLEPDLRVRTTVVHPGDTLVLYTDGLTDLPGDQAVTTEQLSDLLRDRADASAEEVADAIHELKRRRCPDGGRDDTALLVVRFTDPTPPIPERRSGV